MKAWLCTILLTLGSPAFADGYAGLSLSLGGVKPLAGLAAIGVEGGRRIGETDFGYRGAVDGGPLLGDELHGGLAAARGGLEYRPDCSTGCVYAGVDAALVVGQLLDGPEKTTVYGLAAVPRVGIESRGDIRVRFGLELPIGIGRVHEQLPDLVVPRDTTSYGVIGGFSFTAGVGGAF